LSACWSRCDISNGCAPSQPSPIGLPHCSKIIPLPGDRRGRGIGIPTRVLHARRSNNSARCRNGRQRWERDKRNRPPAQSGASRGPEDPVAVLNAKLQGVFSRVIPDHRDVRLYFRFVDGSESVVPLVSGWPTVANPRAPLRPGASWLAEAPSDGIVNLSVRWARGRRFFSEVRSGRSACLGDFAPSSEGALARSAAAVGSDGFGIGNVEEVRHLIVNRQKSLRLFS
jgi:hypothetical protein